jgi:hypothetical protein
VSDRHAGMRARACYHLPILLVVLKSARLQPLIKRYGGRGLVSLPLQVGELQGVDL